MAVKKLQAIRAASKPVFKPDAANLVWLVIVGIGLLPFTLLALLALVVILVLLVMFAGGSQLTHSPDPSVSGSSAPGEIITELAGGDGRGTFAGANVPDQKLVEPIVDAAQECDLLTPVIIAAQIEWASGFDPKWEGPDGGKGLSQLPPRSSASSVRTTTKTARCRRSIPRTRSTPTRGTSATWPARSSG
ncbi:hypothetical protein Psuf_038510 [Phytohabitans suffuscus]|uniref:Transglycosylase SLT domain-containing protein n=1 Tax=Phytohabitans suffuscus TaxID=624315 RepID=A0A6F8YKQ7_9ACTN|nr:hypothetical protein [Phytohabitans suffuscus]BCB86538.1 hypothetical protein Psuf_038510 [Phytohabitans suffuscus]